MIAYLVSFACYMLAAFIDNQFFTPLEVHTHPALIVTLFALSGFMLSASDLVKSRPGSYILAWLGGCLLGISICSLLSCVEYSRYITYGIMSFTSVWSLQKSKSHHIS